MVSSLCPDADARAAGHCAESGLVGKMLFARSGGVKWIDGMEYVSI